MKILVYGDAHWGQYSSIVRKNGDKYSLRLHNLIDSINFVECTAEKNKCEAIVNLGDFFDKSELNAEEITALHEVNWYEGATHFNIIGNHEMGRNDLSTSSCDLFNLMPSNFFVIYQPCIFSVKGCELAFLPYCLEENRNPIDFPISTEPRRILFSHNDIKGIQMGQFISQIGYTIEELESCCDVCFNGHLHNGARISNKIINVGNVTGQNFSEDAFKYGHNVLIIDTDTLQIEFVANPYAFNFYKIDYNNIDKNISLGSNAVVSIKCKNTQVDEVKEWLKKSNVVESRITVEADIVNVDSIIDVESFSIDHIKQFNEYILSTMENTEILLQELQEVSR